VAGHRVSRTHRRRERAAACMDSSFCLTTRSAAITDRTGRPPRYGAGCQQSSLAIAGLAALRGEHPGLESGSPWPAACPAHESSGHPRRGPLGWLSKAARLSPMPYASADGQRAGAVSSQKEPWALDHAPCSPQAVSPAMATAESPSSTGPMRQTSGRPGPIICQPQQMPHQNGLL
jgi:hypothetical protein